MKFESRKVALNNSQQETFDYLKKMDNYEKLIPENAEFIPHDKGEGFAVQLKGLPKVALKLKEVNEPKTIHFGSAISAFDYDLIIYVNEVEANKSEVYFDFNGKFNPMIEMMAKKPLTNFVTKLADNLESKGLS